MKKLVIVESPTKAKTIRRFLGEDYLVESCMGHIRDLPHSSKDLPKKFKTRSWARFGVNLDDNFTPVYCVPADKRNVVNKLKTLLKSAGELILATDEDREGESISWHLQELLNPQVPVKRMVFHEITSFAIEEALKNFRSVDSRLVQAQEARRILDRLVGYSISPFLWKKVLRGLSAGRVQSVAVSLVSKRELARLGFKKTSYWDAAGECEKNGQAFEVRLVEHEGRRLVRSSDFDSLTGARKKSASPSLLMDQKSAAALTSRLLKKTFKVVSVEKKQVTKRPPPPFITSTLQQEASRRFRFSSRQTMSFAQKLYEQGWITYMRTDSTFLSSEALKAARDVILNQFGKEDLPPSPRVYRKKAKGAQEAHEAIRPAGRKWPLPNQIKLSGDLLKLYELIWKRAVASQMKDGLQNQVRVLIQAERSVFAGSGVSMAFPGFYKVYKEGQIQDLLLPDMKKGDVVSCIRLEPTPHATKPPARYTEASLIQTLEKEGVGRPSTYAGIISTIQDRGYVKKVQNTLLPTFTALVVDRLLSERFPDYVNVQFTSEMEKDLDEIALGKKDHIKYLKAFYFGDKGLQKLMASQDKETVNLDFRSFTLKGFEDYSFHVGPFGAYVSKKNTEGAGNKEPVSVSLPAELLPGDMTQKDIEQLIQNKKQGGRRLGKHPETQQDIIVILGRYGPYVQLGVEAKPSLDSLKASSKTAQPKLKRVSLSPFFKWDSITLEAAVKLLELPKVLGLHPETKKEIKKGVGRYGPYVVHDGDFRSVPADGFFELDLKQALSRLKEPKKGRGGGVVKVLGPHPKSGRPIQLMKGRYGPYLRYNKKNISLPSGTSLTEVSLKMAVEAVDSARGGKASARARLKRKAGGARPKKKKISLKPSGRAGK